MQFAFIKAHLKNKLNFLRVGLYFIPTTIRLFKINVARRWFAVFYCQRAEELSNFDLRLK